MGDTPLWERQFGESIKAFQAFATYRDLGDGRSLRLVSQQVGKSKALMDRWSSRWRWVERVKAWEHHRDAEGRKAELKAIKDMRARHAQEAVALQTKALERLKVLDASALTPNDVLRFFVEAAKLERVARGQPETITQQEVTGKNGGPVEVKAQVRDLSRLSDAELVALESIVAKVEDMPDDGA